MRQRLYRGYCRYNDSLDAAVESFNSARAEIEAILAEAQLRANAKNRALSYFENFYEIVNDPEERF